MKKFIISMLVSFFFLFAVGCGEGYENAESNKDEHYKGEQMSYKGNVKLWNFDNNEIGNMPNGFSNQTTGKGDLGKWEVIKDDTAPKHTQCHCPDISGIFRLSFQYDYQ